MAAQEPLVYHNFFSFNEEDKNQTKTTLVESSKGSENNIAFQEEVDEETCTIGSSQNTSQFEESNTAPLILSGPFSLDIPTSEDIASEQSLQLKDTTNLNVGGNHIFSDKQQKRKKFGDTESTTEKRKMDTNPHDSLDILKVARVEDRKRVRHDLVTDDLHLSMQPPRLILNPSNPSPAVKVDGLGLVSKKWISPQLESLNLGMFASSRSDSQRLHGDNVVTNNFRETGISPAIQISPADEGSRTGLKGSRTGNILNSGSSNPITNTGSGTFGRSKSLSQNSATESTFLASQQPTPLTKQLTIFYGGQAHVFEDVSSDKVEAIMALAGSSGRSWSTTYSPRPVSNTTAFGSEDRLSSFDRERDKGNSTYTGQGSSQSGNLGLHDFSSQLSGWATVMKNISNEMMKKKADGCQ